MTKWHFLQKKIECNYKFIQNLLLQSHRQNVLFLQWCVWPSFFHLSNILLKTPCGYKVLLVLQTKSIIVINRQMQWQPWKSVYFFTTTRLHFNFQVFFIVHCFTIKFCYHVIREVIPNFIVFCLQPININQKRRFYFLQNFLDIPLFLEAWPQWFNLIIIFLADEILEILFSPSPPIFQ